MNYDIKMHPTKNEILSYCSGTMDFQGVCRIEQHILDCAECAQAVAAVVRNLIRLEFTSCLN